MANDHTRLNLLKTALDEGKEVRVFVRSAPGTTHSIMAVEEVQQGLLRFRCPNHQYLIIETTDLGAIIISNAPK